MDAEAPTVADMASVIHMLSLNNRHQGFIFKFFTNLNNGYLRLNYFGFYLSLKNFDTKE